MRNSYGSNIGIMLQYWHKLKALISCHVKNKNKKHGTSSESVLLLNLNEVATLRVNAARGSGISRHEHGKKSNT